VFLCCEIERQDAVTSSNKADHHDLGSKLWDLYLEGVGCDAIIELDGKEFKVGCFWFFLCKILNNLPEFFK
jgi:hypothetical protein